MENTEMTQEEANKETVREYLQNLNLPEIVSRREAAQKTRMITVTYLRILDSQGLGPPSSTLVVECITPSTVL